MTQTTHTPGPWHICEATKRDLKIVRDDNGFCVAQAIQPGNSRAAYINAEANLHLIAAAPELLAALENLIFDCEAHGLTDNDAHLREARAAIAKAKGSE